MRGLKYIAVIALIALAVVLSCEPAAYAQCAMCRASLAGSNATFVRNLNIGVLVLLVPPVTIFCSIFVILKRRGARDE
jgi:hypothetical protein